ncbi:hypothetical protein DFP73DRAFT_295682 [Morchella snyderi]|nr:hypothetical protein DFP73DRAFT_295682 [Morchella snyderi]
MDSSPSWQPTTISLLEVVIGARFFSSFFFSLLRIFACGPVCSELECGRLRLRLRQTDRGTDALHELGVGRQLGIDVTRDVENVSDWPMAGVRHWLFGGCWLGGSILASTLLYAALLCSGLVWSGVGGEMYMYIGRVHVDVGVGGCIFYGLVVA